MFLKKIQEQKEKFKAYFERNYSKGKLPKKVKNLKFKSSAAKKKNKFKGKK